MHRRAGMGGAKSAMAHAGMNLDQVLNRLQVSAVVCCRWLTRSEGNSVMCVDTYAHTHMLSFPL